MIHLGAIFAIPSGKVQATRRCEAHISCHDVKRTTRNLNVCHGSSDNAFLPRLTTRSDAKATSAVVCTVRRDYSTSFIAASRTTPDNTYAKLYHRHRKTYPDDYTHAHEMALEDWESFGVEGLSLSDPIPCSESVRKLPR
jgi:hypothetical protein